MTVTDMAVSAYNTADMWDALPILGVLLGLLMYIHQPSARRVFIRPRTESQNKELSRWMKSSSHQ